MKQDKKGSELDMTQIQITKRTRSKLLQIGKKGDTYDEIINKLIK